MAEQDKAASLNKQKVRFAYNLIAGQNAERLAALSDGVFAFAMTLLALDLRVPAAELVHNERDLWTALVHMAPRVLVWGMSFLSLGIFWVGQQTQLNHLEKSDRDLTWIHLGFLIGVTLMPFSTSLLGEYMQYRVALIEYWMNILVLGAMLYWSWGHVTHRGLAKGDMPEHVPAAICRRIVIAQSLYAGGALLCLINTYWSIGAIVLLQLNYAIAPRLGGVRKEQEE
jgi:TMEM175 potassium channel family protein